MLTFIIVLSAAGERFLVGALTGTAFAIIVWAVEASKKKRSEKDEEERKRNEQEAVVDDLKRRIAKLSGPEYYITTSDYATLAEELKTKCNPANYLDPYDPVKVERANAIYATLLNSTDNLEKLIDIRNQAIKELGIGFSSERVFTKLCHIYDPKQFMGDNYDAELLSVSNKVYSDIIRHKDNINALEEIAKRCGILVLDSRNLSRASDSEKDSTNSMTDKSSKDELVGMAKFNASYEESKGVPLVEDPKVIPLVVLIILFLLPAVIVVVANIANM